jgi:hypothetical protein
MTSHKQTYLSIDDAEKVLRKMIKDKDVICTYKGYYYSGKTDEGQRYSESFSHSKDKPARNKAKLYFSSEYDVDYKDVKLERSYTEDRYVYAISRRKIDNYSIRKLYQEEGFKKFIEEHKDNFCMIRTDSGFWHQSHSGYVTQSKAGIFPVEEAFQTISHCGLEKSAELYIVTKEDLKGYREPLLENIKRINKYIKVLETGENK